MPPPDAIGSLATLLPGSGNRVAIAWGPDSYDASAPFSASSDYPENPFPRRISQDRPNGVYETVREALWLLWLDAHNFGSRRWNPLGGIVRPGDTVVLKPNFVRDFRETQLGHGDCLITHGAVIRAVLDYVYIALGGRGRIIIADAPQNDADFAAIQRIAGLSEIQAFYRQHASFDVEVYDLRPERAIKVDGVICGHEPLQGDPSGYVKVNLGPLSAFSGIEHLCGRLYGSEYETGELRRHHTGGVHEYLISRTALAADCIMNLPKLKTHKKTGITACMKNLVGINGNKNWLPHYREGTPSQGGDQFADDGLMHRVERCVVAAFKRAFPYLGPLRRRVAKPMRTAGARVFGETDSETIRSGNWYGNDTAWRMVLDLNRILLYADAQGQLHDTPVRRVLSLVDGIVAGEGNGPLDPTPRPAGVVLAGANPLAVDVACARVMGFDHRRLPVVDRAFNEHPLSLAGFGPEDIAVRSNEERLSGPLAAWEGPVLAVEPHFGWKGKIECHDQANSTATPAPNLLDPVGEPVRQLRTSGQPANTAGCPSQWIQRPPV